ncbi:MAG: RluA family pseudouridine synthase [Acidobacteria bacterium]|nr:RluA family pseudouridine synthase [Acidobacteriota bacterium]
MSKQFHFHITATEVRQRLDVFLASQLGSLSRIRIANLLAAGACLVNQQSKPAGYHLALCDEVEITIDDSLPTAMQAEKIALEILHEDEQILVVVKPSGMLVHPTRNVKSGTLLNALAYHLNPLRIADASIADYGLQSAESSSNHLPAQEVTGASGEPETRESAIRNSLSAIEASAIKAPAVVRPGLIHRLDRATSGVMVIAKTQKALGIIGRHFQKRLVKKLYLAIVEGEVAAESGAIIAPIGLDESLRPPRWVTEDGKYAETRFRVIERRTHATLIELEPVTGRTNQLRIHCAYQGHPIVGDEIYFAPPVAVESDRAQPATDNEQALTVNPAAVPSFDPQTPDTRHRTSDAMRLCLHAARLEFHHPQGGQWMTFDSPMPQAMQTIWQRFA